MLVHMGPLQVMGLEDWCVACEDGESLRICGDTIAFLKNLHRSENSQTTQSSSNFANVPY